MSRYAHQPNEPQMDSSVDSAPSKPAPVSARPRTQMSTNYRQLANNQPVAFPLPGARDLEAVSAVGNASVSDRVLRRATVHAGRPAAQTFSAQMLRTSLPNATAERQAHSVADGPTVRLTPERLREPVTSAPSQLPRSIMFEATQGGQSLPGSARSEMEQRLGTSFENVRVHTDRKAAAAAEAAGASALTMDRHIVFAAGRYQPHTSAGKRLLAHELTHIAQIKQGAPADVVYGNWHPRGVNTLRDAPGVILCMRRWPYPAPSYRMGPPPPLQRWAIKVEYFAPLNLSPSYGIANEYWALIEIPLNAAPNMPRIVTGAHASAWFSTRYTFPSTRPSQPTPEQAFVWFQTMFDADLRSGLVTAGVPGARVFVSETPPPGCPCP